MSLVTIGPEGRSPSIVSSGTIYMPRIGAWHADLVIDATEVPTGRQEISIGDTGVLVGTVNRASIESGSVRARIVAGADGLRKLTTPKYFEGAGLRLGIPLAAAVADGDEVLSVTSDKAVLDQLISSWTTVETTVGLALQALAAVAPDGTAWRFLPDGSIWIGAETWPEAAGEAREIEATPESATVELGLDQPWLLPGTTLGDRRIDRVEHRITGDSVRATVWTAPPAASVVDPFQPYRTFYAGRVLAQGANLRVDIQFDDPTIPPMSRIELRSGIAGATVKLRFDAQAPRVRVLLGFENADPRAPFAALWGPADKSSVEKVVLDLGHLLVEADKVELGGKNLTSLLNGVVLGQCIDPFTGKTHAQLGGASSLVMAKK